MDKAIRNAQLTVLKTFASSAESFALSGGTALEMFYLKHRFSRDLDFFSADYKLAEINQLVSEFGRALAVPVKLENAFSASDHARVRFYTARIPGAGFPLKLDFVEEVFFSKPKIVRIRKIPVYDIKNIYMQKVLTLTGSRLVTDEIGREAASGRKSARDMVDIFYLSKKVEPLHRFMRTIDRQYQRGLVQWYRSYSRQELKLGVLDLDLYDARFDAAEMIRYLDAEIKTYISEVLR